MKPVYILLWSRHDLFCRLAIAVQNGTENAPEKAKKMKLKVNNQNAPFKQVRKEKHYKIVYLAQGIRAWLFMFHCLDLLVSF